MTTTTSLNPNGPIRAIIFDMDGLMIDSEKIYWAVTRRIAGSFGKEVADETLGRMMGRSPLDSVALLAAEVGLPQSPQELHAMREEAVEKELKKGVEPMPGLLDVLPRFKARFLLGVATSAPMYLVDIVLGGLHLKPVFDVLQTSDDVVKGKPDPEIYLKAMSRLGVKPAETIVLEDSSNGSLAAKRAGAYAIAVPSQYTRRQDFSFVDYVAIDLLDAARHIDTRFRN
jgi:HAD superfamily hydrolase (TIGR01509 family)